MALVTLGTVQPLLRKHRGHPCPPNLSHTGIVCTAGPKKLRLLEFVTEDSDLQMTKIEPKKLNRVEARHVAVRAVLATNETTGQADLASLKTVLLGVIAGLDRGLVANEADIEATDGAARQLEAAGTVRLPEDLDKLQGRWRLIYSSAFTSGSLGGRRPGPPVGRLPLTLGQVYQRIDVSSRELDNIVDLRIGTPWPLPSLEVTATLAHTFGFTGGVGIQIIFEKTIVKPRSLLQLPPFVISQLPDFLRPPFGIRSGSFQVTYLDEDFRISRGDQGELRIFLQS